MTQRDAGPEREPATHTTRRNAVTMTGGIALGLLAALGGRPVATARQATPPAPAASGGYAVIRVREHREDEDEAALLERIHTGYVPLVREIPGFVSYTAISDPGSRNQAFIAVFEDKAGADESTRLAGEWLRENDLDPFVGDPIVVEGDIAFAIDAGSDV